MQGTFRMPHSKNPMSLVREVTAEQLLQETAMAQKYLSYTVWTKRSTETLQCSRRNASNKEREYKWPCIGPQRNFVTICGPDQLC